MYFIDDDSWLQQILGEAEDEINEYNGLPSIHKSVHPMYRRKSPEKESAAGQDCAPLTTKDSNISREQVVVHSKRGPKRKAEMSTPSCAKSDSSKTRLVKKVLSNFKFGEGGALILDTGRFRLNKSSYSKNIF